MVARLAHCRLFGVNGAGRPISELARRAFIKDDALVVDLVPGARFHNGTLVTARHVVASLARVRDLGAASPLAGMARQLRARAVAPDQVAVELPRGIKSRTLKRLLARPELSVLADGKPGGGRGCGAFRVQRVNARGARLVAFDGHARGRPRIDTLDLTVVANDAEEVERFVFDRIDISFEASHRYPRSTMNLAVGRSSTVYAMVHPGWAPGRDARVRHSLWRAATKQSLARFMPWEVSMATSPWPASLSPSSRTLDSRRAPGRLDDVGQVIIAFPRGDKALAALARVIRDRIRPIAVGGVRIRPVANLSLASAPPPAASGAAAASAEPAPWHIGIAIYDWAALDRAQAAWEASQALGAGGLSALDALGGRARGWADGVVRQTRLLPLVHVDRAVYHRGAFALVGGTGAVRFDDSYKRP